MRQRPPTSIFLVLVIAALAGCGSIKNDIEPPPPTPAQKAQQLEPMLAAAGFRMLPADTPERQQRMQQMVPFDVNYYLGKTGTLHYYMADPQYCNCIYLGSEEDYQKFEQLKLNQQFQTKEGEISRQQLEAQQLEDMDMQEEMFNPYGLGLAGPMGPSIYW